MAPGFASAQSSNVRTRAVRLWLLAVAALIFLTLIVGGATRLTQSGLSIVEWKPVTGVVPPLSQQAWQDEFAKYRTIPQYRELNEGMSLDRFKTIYWWEWTHRMLARLIGAVFLLPLLFFLWRGWLGRREWIRLFVIFGLGAFQGAVGWWMVSSGLSAGVSVSQYRLAFHLTLASLIYAAIVWTALRLAPRTAADAPVRVRTGALVLAGLMLLQLYLGALVAGLHAGLIFNTWPDIDGGFIPPAHDLFVNAPWWRNF
ncbi:MAG TPA: COX15/CtaA family protein, partial [Pseudolabrys sp.]|nr:COX15/CtaA family protein [Pseudolabrys sp.]